MRDTTVLAQGTSRDADYLTCCCSYQIERQVCLLCNGPEPLKFAFLRHISKLQSHADCQGEQQHIENFATGRCPETSLQIFRCHITGIVCDKKCAVCGGPDLSEQGSQNGPLLLSDKELRPTWRCIYMYSHVWFAFGCWSCCCHLPLPLLLSAARLLNRAAVCGVAT